MVLRGPIFLLKSTASAACSASLFCSACAIAGQPSLEPGSLRRIPTANWERANKLQPVAKWHCVLFVFHLGNPKVQNVKMGSKQQEGPMTSELGSRRGNLNRNANDHTNICTLPPRIVRSFASGDRFRDLGKHPSHLLSNHSRKKNIPEAHGLWSPMHEKQNRATTFEPGKQVRACFGRTFLEIVFGYWIGHLKK